MRHVCACDQKWSLGCLDASRHPCLPSVHEHDHPATHNTHELNRHPLLAPPCLAHTKQGLRVVDASVFPHIPNGNTQAATFMVAEKAAEMILRDAEA